MILVACNYSAEAPRACARAGFECITVDYHEAEGPPRMHVQGDLRDVLYRRWWAAVLAFPSCTNTALSGAERFDAKRAAGLQWHGIASYCLLWCAPSNVCILEHSISVVPKYVPVEMQRVQPYMFEGGGDVRKAADLAIRGAPPVPTLPPDQWPAATRNYTHEHREAERDAREVMRSRTEPAMAAALVAHMVAHAGAPPNVQAVPALHDVLAAAAARYEADGHPLPPSWNDPLARRPGGDEARLTEVEGRATRRGLLERGEARIRRALAPVDCAHGRTPIPCTAAWWDDGLMPDGSRPCRRPDCARAAAVHAAAPSDEVDCALRAHDLLHELGHLATPPAVAPTGEAMARAMGPQSSADITQEEEAAWRRAVTASDTAEALRAALRRLAARHLRRRGPHSCKAPRLHPEAVEEYADAAGAARPPEARGESPDGGAAAGEPPQGHGTGRAEVTVYIVPTNHQYGAVKMRPDKTPFTFTLSTGTKPGERRAAASETARSMLPGLLPEAPDAVCFVAGVVGTALLVVAPTSAAPWAPSGIN